MNKLLPRIIFYGLIVATAFAAALLYYRTTAPQPESPAPTAAPANTNQEANTNAPTTTNTPAAKNNNTPQPVPAPVPAKPTCIITIDGQHYDVQPLRNTHSGGDVFQCGTDMSSVFHGQHGSNLQMIRKYLVP